MQTASFYHEQQYWQSGYTSVIGIDEVGRGSWAGPVVAAGVIFSQYFTPDFFLADSKLLTAVQREQLNQKIIAQAQSYTIAEVDVATINKIGIGKATHMAFRKVLQKLVYDFILIDAFYIGHVKKAKQLPIIRGDKICASIAAASIIAKVHRDGVMSHLHRLYPQYNFAKHKGYGTKEHQRALAKFGLSKIHRTSFNLLPYAA